MRLNDDKLLKVLGLASRSNKLIYGEKLFSKLKEGKIKLILTVKDMGQTQLKKINNKANFYKIQIINDLFDSNNLNKAIGKSNIKCIGICDQNFVKLILNNIE